MGEVRPKSAKKPILIHKHGKFALKKHYFELILRIFKKSIQKNGVFRCSLEIKIFGIGNISQRLQKNILSEK